MTRFRSIRRIDCAPLNCVSTVFGRPIATEELPVKAKHFKTCPSTFTHVISNAGWNKTNLYLTLELSGSWNYASNASFLTFCAYTGGVKKERVINMNDITIERLEQIKDNVLGQFGLKCGNGLLMKDAIWSNAAKEDTQVFVFDDFDF